MLRVRVKMRSGACALSHQDADTGEGYQEFMGAVCYQRSSLFNIGVCVQAVLKAAIYG
jgi:hypothetical protein